MEGIEHDNPSLQGVLPKDYARPVLDKQRLGQLIDLISNISLGDKESRSQDILGRVYEYFLSQFASAEGKKGGEFYTPRCVVRLLVEMIEPFKGRVYDPCCGSSGMFVQSEEFIAAHGGRIGDISIYGQESNHTTWRLAKMNLALRGIDGQIAQGDSFHNDRFPDLEADYILANPPFNVSDWRGHLLNDDKRWKYGVPPAGNANFAWVQHIVHHLAPNGVAGFVLANGSMSFNQSGEGEIRKRLIEADLVDCMIALPGQLFYSLPNAAFIGFTGTPIEQTDANTRNVFGNYISVYDIQRAVEDKATVPIYYEGRLAKLGLEASERPRIDPDFEEATEGEEVARKERLKSKWGQLEAVVGAGRRLQLVARDIVEHLEKRTEALEGKAMIVCMSRRFAWSCTMRPLRSNSPGSTKMTRRALSRS